MSEEFSPAEQAYFSSKGADTSGFEAESVTETPQAPASNGGNGAPPASYSPTGGPPEGQEQPSGEDDGEEVVIVGKDGKPRSTNGRFVPHQALHAERERRKGVETELGTYREKMARADERLAVLNEMMTKADAPPSRTPEAPIDPEVDPIGALKQSYQKIAALEKQLTESTTQQSERENARAMLSAYEQDARRFSQEKPEFADAYRYMFEVRHRQLDAIGLKDPAARNRFIADEERQLVSEAFKSRMSPAQMIYNLAVASGFSHTPPAPAPAKPNHAEKIEQIAKGQRAAGVSLSSAGGSAGEGLTAAALADMSEEEFASVAAKLGKSKMRQLMGG
jgi:hypothetical protein